MNERTARNSRDRTSEEGNWPDGFAAEIALVLESAARPHPSVVLNLLISIVNGRHPGDPLPAAPARYADGGQEALRRLELDLTRALACPPEGVEAPRIRALLSAVCGFREEVLAWPIEPARTARRSAIGAVAQPI
jgi:hypothetical protein